MLQKTLLTALLMAFAWITNAQTTVSGQKVEASQVPQVVKDAQEANYAGIAVTKWELHKFSKKDKEAVKYVAVFKDGELRVRARYKYKDNKAEGISASTYYGPKKLPAEVQKTVTATYASYQVVGAAKIKIFKSGKEYYKVRLKKAAERLTVFLNLDGSQIDSKNVPAEAQEEEEQD